MGTTAFPSTLYPCILAEGYEAEPTDDVGVQKARDGTELRLHHGTGWYAVFTLRTRTSALRTTLRDFRTARKGKYDSFPFTAPDDGITRQVRFEEFSGPHVSGAIWDYRIRLVQVPE